MIIIIINQMDLDIQKPVNDESSDILIKISKYDHAKKTELVKKINKIKKKEYLLNIFKLITTSTKDFTENTNGVFIFFHNLEDEVYEKLENYVNNIYRLYRKNSSLKSIISSELSDNIITFSETINDNTDNLNSVQNISRSPSLNLNKNPIKSNDPYDNNFNKDNKELNKNLSNKEKMIIKRKKYEEYLNQNQAN